MKKIFFLIGLSFFLNSLAFSDDYHEKEILTLAQDSVGEIASYNIYKVAVGDGETAFLVAASLANSARNYWGKYILVRPKLQKALPLDSYGGQYNHVQEITTIDGKSLVIIGASSSGQGYVYSSQSIVSFSGWKVKDLYTVESESSWGACPDPEDTDITAKCYGKKVFLQPLDDSGPDEIYIVETSVMTEGKDTKHLQRRIETKMLHFDMQSVNE